MRILDHSILDGEHIFSASTRVFRRSCRRSERKNFNEKIINHALSRSLRKRLKLSTCRSIEQQTSATEREPGAVCLLLSVALKIAWNAYFESK
jgi:hypothetical protein